MFDGAAFGKEIVTTVKTYVERTLEPVLGRLDVLERDPPKMAALVEETVDRVLRGWERPQNGIDGKEGAPGRDGQDGPAGADGKDAELIAPDDIAEIIASAVKMLVQMPDAKELPPPPSQLTIHFPAIVMPEFKLPGNVVNVAIPEQQPPVINMAAPVVNMAPTNVQVDLPKRGKEITRVTGHDKAGRITSFERHEVDE